MSNILSTIISCSAPYGNGGLGQRLAEFVENRRNAGVLAEYFCGATKLNDHLGRTVYRGTYHLLLKNVVQHFGPGLRTHFGSDGFDRAVCDKLTRPIDCFVGFSGQALHSFRRAKELGATRLELVAPTAHVEYAYQQYLEAIHRNPIEGSWLNRSHLNKTKREYAMADVIWVVSDYVASTFIQAGIDSERINNISTEIDDRFVPPQNLRNDDTFRVVYTGALTVTKGIPLLLEAFEALDVKKKQLTLIGGWGTRSMRKYLQRWTQGRSDILIGPGDPLPHLQQANVYVHPSWQDGFGRAPYEALCCGVPVIVTADTGMKEFIREGETGYVVPTGDVPAIRRRLAVLASKHVEACASGAH